MTTLSPDNQVPIVSRSKESFIILDALLSHSNHPPTYAQIYILDTAEQLNVRRLNNRNLDPVVIDNLQTMLLDNHPYIGHYRHAYELTSLLSL